MKKRLLSLLLMVALLLSAIPAVGATEAASEPDFSYSLTLNESIAINFKVARADVAEGFEYIEFFKNGSSVEKITEIPEGNSEKAVFSFTDLTPYELGTTIKAELHVNGTVYTKEASVLSYCETILAGDYHYSLKKIAVDLLNYGAATQTYVGDTSKLVNADADQTLGTPDSSVLSLTNITSQGDELTDAAASWTGVGLNLKDSVTIRFKFAANSTNGLKLKVTCNGKSWEITEFQSADTEGQYYAYLSELNPAQMRDAVTAVVCNSEDTAVSRELTYSIESYAAYVTADTTGSYADELPLVKAMMRYGDTVAAWLEGGSLVQPDTMIDLETGNYNIVAVADDAYYAMGNTVSSNAVSASNVTVENGAITTADAPVWTVTMLDKYGTATLTNPEDGEYLTRGNGSSNIGIGKTHTVWTIAKDEDTGYYTITNKNSDTRYLSYNGSGFKAYAKSNTGGDTGRYIQFLLIPVETEPVLESGNYAVVAVAGSEHYAMSNTMDTTVSFNAVSVTAANGAVSPSCVDTWNITIAADGTAALATDAGKYLSRDTGSSNLKLSDNAANWSIVKDEATGYYTLTNTNDDTRCLSYNGSGFKAYAEASTGGDTGRYIQFLLIPVSENVEHIWNEGETTTAATCTTDGVTTYTCSVCGDIKKEAIPAIGHDWTNGNCANCDEILYATQVNSLSDITDGEYMIIAQDSTGAYFVMTQTSNGSLISSASITVENGKVQVNDSCRWTITIAEAGTDSLTVYLGFGGKYLYNTSSSKTNVNMHENTFDWTMTFHADDDSEYFHLQSSLNETRYLSYTADNGGCFKAYTVASSRYPKLLLFKIPTE